MFILRTGRDRCGFFKEGDLVSKVEDILKKCNNEIRAATYKPLSREYKYGLVVWSFNNNFESIQNKISFDSFEKEDFDKFIEICNNRLERSKVLLNEIAVVLGFDFSAFAVIAAIAKIKDDTTIWSLIKDSNDPIFRFIILLLLAALILLFGLLGHYRTQIHAWTAFREKAILVKQPEKCEKSALAPSKK